MAVTKVIFSKIDKHGRVLIPKVFRERLKLKHKDNVEIELDGSNIVITKAYYTNLSEFLNYIKNLKNKFRRD